MSFSLNIRKWLRKIFKIFAWFIVSLLFLFIVIILLVQTDPVQNYIIQKATHYISDRTKTSVNIGHISIHFPKMISIENVFLDDKQKDTLLSAGRISIDIDLFELLNNKLNIGELEIDNLYANINNTEGDSLFNYDFLPKAFVQDSGVKVSDTTKKPMAFNIGNIRLRNIRFSINDRFHQSDLYGRIGAFEIDFNKFDIEKRTFIADDIKLSQSYFVRTDNNSNTSNDGANGQLPDIQFKNLTVQNVRGKVANYFRDDELKFDIANCVIIPGHLDLPQSTIRLNSILLDDGKIEIRSKKIASNKSASKNKDVPWNFSTEKIVMKNTGFRVDMTNMPEKNGFDPNHISIQSLNFNAINTEYKNENVSAEINQLSFIERHGFELNSLKSKVVFTDKHASLNDLEIVTPNSRIGNKITVSYSSPGKISEQISSLKIDADLKNCVIGTKDILYFNPQLSAQPALKNQRNIFVDAKIYGNVGNLNVPELYVRYGNQTSIRAKGKITGLPEINKTFVNLSVLSFYSGRKDLARFTGDSVAKYIPEHLRGRLNYKGSIKNFNADLDLTSSSGSVSANVNMLPGTENYHATVRLKDIDLHEILHDTTLGKISMSIDAKGFSFDKSKAYADVDAKVLSTEYNKYIYKNLSIVAHVSDKYFEGNINMNDSNVAFTFDGKVDLHKDSEEFKFDFNLKAIDLYRLHLANKDIRLSAQANADLKGSSINTFNGTAGITNLTVIQEGKNYTIDSVLFASVNEKGRSSLTFTSSILSAKFEGTMAPEEIPNTILQQLNSYFDIGDTTKMIQAAQNLTFEIRVQNNPLLNEVLIPGLMEFEPLSIKGALNSTDKTFALKVDVPRIKYTGINIRGLSCEMNANRQKINYELKFIEASNESIRLATTDLSGIIQNDEATLNMTIIDSTIEKLKLNAKLISLRQKDYRFQILPDGLSFNKQSWNVPEDNFIRFGRNGLLFNNFKLSNNQQLIAIHSPSQSVATEIAFEFKNFQLQTLSQLIEKDSSFVTGEFSGNVQLNEKGNSGLTADLDIRSMTLHSIPVGDIKIKAEKTGLNDYVGSLKLSGNENNVDVNANFKGGSNSIIDADIKINSLSMNSLSAFSNGQLKDASGNVTGAFKITGALAGPSIKGNLNFHDASFHSTAANNRFTLKNEKLSFDNEGIYLSNFTIIDSTGNHAIINGKIAAENFSPQKYDLTLRLDNFTVLNTGSTDNKLFYGTLRLNSNTTITGNASLPRIYSKTKLLDKSYLTVSVPESKITNDRGEGVVLFIDPNQKINPILTRKTEEDATKSSIRGFAVTADLEVDKNSSLKIVIDPVAGDSLVVKGEGNLSFTMDASGKTSLTGLYTVTEGKYRVSLQELIHKDFSIKKGSTLNWSGDPMDAEVNIDAVYERKTSPADLVAGQLGGLSDAERNKYKQNIPFLVILHIKGQMLKPDISFEIDLPEKYRSAMGGTVYAKLQQLNSDESELNKQVFALLVLGRFIQEDPLASNGGSGIESAARTSVSKILSAQLNKLSDQYIKGVELDFDLQSFDDYSTGTVEEKTQLEVGIKKQLLDERLSVQVGSMVDLSNNGAKTGSSELASDITLEYKLTDNGRYSLKVFRQNQYEDILDGPINVTGAGVIYTRDFDYWKNLFNKEDKSGDDVTIPYKDE